ncbi:MAG: hypothetical protein WBE13_13245 [Candidatus Acidiferrum sp.]
MSSRASQVLIKAVPSQFPGSPSPNDDEHTPLAHLLVAPRPSGIRQAERRLRRYFLYWLARYR